jgi:RNA polymerase sigma factor (sigma-70 family)
MRIVNHSAELARSFEENRRHLQAVAYRMLGSLTEAEDAVQEAWLRLSRADVSTVQNLGGWLTTVVARVCLDMLRSRRARREEMLGVEVTDPAEKGELAGDPETEAILADSVGLALLVVLETLEPAERLAFVLHDLFAVSFDEVAAIVGRTPAAARQLASRARRRVQGAPAVPEAELGQQREVVQAFLMALRSDDVQALLSVLHPDAVIHGDSGVAAGQGPLVLEGAAVAAKGALAFARGARFARPALIDGSVGLVVAPRGKLIRALLFELEAGKIVHVEVLAESERLRALEVALLPD